MPDLPQDPFPPTRSSLVWGSLALLAALAMPIPHEPFGHDGPIHAANVCSLERALSEGDLLPRWLPELNGGLGGPNFKYYSFFAYYAPAVTKLIAGVDTLSALRFSVRVYLFIGLAGVCALAWQLFGMRAALGCVLLHAAFPYQLALVYTRMALPEYAACSWVPWVLVLVVASARTRRPAFLTAAAAAFGLLLCLHNLSAVLWSPFVVLFAMAIPAQQTVVKRLTCAFQVMGGGLLLAAFQFFPSILELSWIQAGHQLNDLAFFSAWVIPFASFLSSSVDSLEFTSKVVPGPVALPLLIAPIVVLAAARRLPSDHGTVRPLAICTAAAIAALLMASPVSILAAQLAPFVAYIQFPWRFLGPAGLFLALSGSGALARLLPGRAPLFIAAFLAGQMLLIHSNQWNPVPNACHVSDPADFTGAVFTSDYEDKYLPVASRLPSEPVRANFEPFGPLSVIAEAADRHTIRVEYEAPASTWVRIHRYCFPGWRARVDDQPCVIERDELLGEIRVALPAGRHSLTVGRERTVLETLYDVLSLSTLATMLLASRWPRRRAAFWSAPALVLAACLVWGSLSAEGFAPCTQDATAHPLPPAILEGWSITTWAGGMGSAMLGSELRPPAESPVELLLEVHAGVACRVNDEWIDLEGEDEDFRQARLIPLPSDAPTRLLILVPDEITAWPVRIRYRPVAPGFDAPWQIAPATWLHAMPHRGYEELFADLGGVAPLLPTREESDHD